MWRCLCQTLFRYNAENPFCSSKNSLPTSLFKRNAKTHYEFMVCSSGKHNLFDFFSLLHDKLQIRKIKWIVGTFSRYQMELIARASSVHQSAPQRPVEEIRVCFIFECYGERKEKLKYLRKMEEIILISGIIQRFENQEIFDDVKEYGA